MALSERFRKWISGARRTIKKRSHASLRAKQPTLTVEALEQRCTPAFAGSPYTYEAGPGEFNDVVVSPGSPYSSIQDAPGVNQITGLPFVASRFLDGLGIDISFGIAFQAGPVEISFGIGVGFPIYPFGLPEGVLGPPLSTVAAGGFDANQAVGSAVQQAVGGVSSAVAGVALPATHTTGDDVFFQVSAVNNNTLPGYRLFQAVVDPANSFTEIESNNTTGLADTIVPRRINRGAVASGSNDIDIFTILNNSGHDNYYSVVLDNNPDGDASLTGTEVSMLVDDTGGNNPTLVKSNVSFGDANAVGPIRVANGDKLFITVENSGAGADAQGEYRFVLIENNPATPVIVVPLNDQVNESEGNNTAGSANSLGDREDYAFGAIPSKLDVDFYRVEEGTDSGGSATSNIAAGHLVFAFVDVIANIDGTSASNRQKTEIDSFLRVFSDPGAAAIASDDNDGPALPAASFNQIQNEINQLVDFGALGTPTNAPIVVNLNDGNDRADLSQVSGQGITVTGGTGHDRILHGGGINTLSGNADNDTFVFNSIFSATVTANGGDGYDIIEVNGGAANDTITILLADDPSANDPDADIDDLLVTVAANGSSTAAFYRDIKTSSIEGLVVNAGDGDDTIVVDLRQGDLGFSGGVSVAGQSFSDKLRIIEQGVGRTIIYRQLAPDQRAGSFEFQGGDTIAFDSINDVAISPLNLSTGGIGGDGLGRIVVFDQDPYEYSEFQEIATDLGAPASITVHGTIDPGSTAGAQFPADSDYYRVEALVTGTLDFQVLFDQVPTLANGNAGLPGDGDLDIEVRDAVGNVITGFGTNDATDDERIRIPAVQGQAYFLRIYGATPEAVNSYSATIINQAPPTPFDMELDDVIVVSTVQAGASATSFAGLNADLADATSFYVGKFLEFTSGNLIGQRSIVTGYTGGATPTFTFAAGSFTAAPTAGSQFQVESNDTGRSQLENVTRDNTPRLLFRLSDGGLLNDLPGNDVADAPPDEVIPIPFRTGAPTAGQGGFAVAVFDEGPTPPATGDPQTPLGFATMISPGVYEFTTPVLTDGSHFLTARVQMRDLADPQRTGFGPRSEALEIFVDANAPPVFFGLPNVPDDGLDPANDSSIQVIPGAVVRRITSDTTPAFFGMTEANAIVRVYVDLNSNNLVDSTDLLIAQTVGTPLDGSNQMPSGRWTAASNVDFTDPRFWPTPPNDPAGGLRRILVTAEDLAGNVSSPPQVLDVFIDTKGPQVFDPDGGGPTQAIQIVTGGVANLTFPLFDVKPSVGPTPLVNALLINFRDLPARAPDFLYAALNAVLAAAPGSYILRGDSNGMIPIQSITVNTPTPVAGQFATATVELGFSVPLPDDRYTLTILDELLDPAGNRFDGESNAAEPNGAPTFPSGNGEPGGSFVARFTVDSRPEIGAWLAATALIDINGDGIWNPQAGGDATNHDLTFKFGIPSDHTFAGNFNLPGTGVNGGYDKLGVYGRVNGKFRFMLDFNGDGVVDANIRTTKQINGVPIAGNFSPFNPGDEVGLFDGKKWHLDTNGNNDIDGGDRVIVGALRGIPIVGDFDGDGAVDLATYQPDNNVFQFDIASNGYGGIDFSTAANSSAGFPGVRERPVGKDMDRDGFADVGLYVPASGSGDSAAWFFLMSGGSTLFNRPSLTFSPAPLGNDVFYSFGFNFPIPVVGNFDPPLNRPAVGSSGLNLKSPIVANVLLTADVQLMGPGSSAGLVSRYSGAGDMYWAGVVNRRNAFFVEIRRRSKGKWTTISSRDVKTGVGQLTFVTSGRTLRVFLNGQLAGSVADKTLVRGRYGFLADGGAGVRNLRAQ